MSTTQIDRAAISMMPVDVALLSARDVAAAPHLVTVAVAQAAIAATHCVLNAAHPIVASLSTRRPKRELDDREHFAALILCHTQDLAELLDDYMAAHDLDAHHDEPPDAAPRG
jgi:hypothetical protein